MIARSDKIRFELKDDKIRALYGDSSTLCIKVNKIPSKPPTILYHGTSHLVIESYNMNMCICLPMKIQQYK